MPRRPRSPIALILGALSHVACAHAPAHTLDGKEPHSSLPPLASTPAAAPSAQLAPDDSYGQLVRAASALEGSAQPGGACVLQQNARGFSLDAELSAAVRPLPLPPEDLDPALKQADRVEILSAWGRYGDGGGKLALASFTRSAPSRDAIALVLTDRGVALRGTGARALGPLDGLDVARASAALDAQPDASVFVTAEAGVPVREVARVLAALADRRAPVALAVSLAPGTALPRLTASAQPELCPDGPPATELPSGSLPVAELAAGVAPLKEQAAACLGQGDARGAAGGRLGLALRISPQGHVQQACLTQDELGDPAVSACVIELARRLRFAAPEPSGVVDVVFPLALRPGLSGGPRAFCDASAHS